MSTPTPHQLWEQSKGDGQEYRRLMELHGHVTRITDENRPKEHPFKGATLRCACETCGGNHFASWHYRETIAHIKPLGEGVQHLRIPVTARLYFGSGEVRIVFPNEAFDYSDHIQLVDLAGVICEDVPEFAVRRGHDLVVSEDGK